jgi:hypothetical protein
MYAAAAAGVLNQAHSVGCAAQNRCCFRARYAPPVKYKLMLSFTGYCASTAVVCCAPQLLLHTCPAPTPLLLQPAVLLACTQAALACCGVALPALPAITAASAVCAVR